MAICVRTATLRVTMRCPDPTVHLRWVITHPGSDAMEYRLIAQGNANAIYTRSDGVSIRVSKIKADPNTIVSYWDTMWRPKLGDYMGPMMVIDDPRFGSVVKIELVGQGPHHQIIGEFKPKWLLQSPCAPANARSCRTCAIKHMRNQPVRYCCLDIGLGENILQLACNIATDSKYVGSIVAALQHSRLLPMLKTWQTKLSQDPATLRDCMSLRDCTVLVELNKLTCQTKLWVVDLDPKLGAEKLEKWEKLETQLSPYYLQRSHVCRLSR